MRNHALSLLAVVLGSIVAVGSATAASPLSYSGSLPDADGISRDISFAGQQEGDAFNGDVTVAGNTMHVVGTIDKVGAATGTVSLKTGEALGTFHVQPADSKSLAVSYQLGGRAGTLAVPVDASPVKPGTEPASSAPAPAKDSTTSTPADSPK